MPWHRGECDLDATESTYPSCDAVPTFHASDLSPAQFRVRFMEKNLPVMITGMTKQWRATKEWVCADGTCDMDAMSKLFGDAKVLVVDCDDKIDTDLTRKQMRFADFAAYWEKRKGKGGKKRKENADGDNGDDDELNKKLYVKDWNFVHDFPDYGAYATPGHVKDDWLNAGGEESTDDWIAGGGLDERVGEAGFEKNEHESGSESESESESDGKNPSASPLRNTPGSFKFVYCGVQGTWTPAHVDVARSFSWSVNVCGHKKWFLVPPNRAKFLRHKDGSGRLLPDLRHCFGVGGGGVNGVAVNGEDGGGVNAHTTLTDFPDAQFAKPLVVEQPPEALLFVPSCWPHQVHNVTDCVSVNHNWFNACSFGTSVKYLRRGMRLIRHGLLDDDDREDGVLCQQLLLRTCGINQLQLAAIGAWALRRTMRGARRLRKALSVFERKGTLTPDDKKRVEQLCERLVVLGTDFMGPTQGTASGGAYGGTQSLLLETKGTYRDDDDNDDPDDESELERWGPDGFVDKYSVSPWDENLDDFASIAAANVRAHDAFLKVTETAFLAGGIDKTAARELLDKAVEYAQGQM